MTTPPDSEAELPPFGPSEWFKVWSKAILHPDKTAYLEIITDPAASLKRVYTWFVVYWLGIILYLSLEELGQSSFGEWGYVCGLAWVVLASLLYLLPQAVGFFVFAGSTHWIASSLGGVGRKSDLIYGMAAYAVPLGFVYILITFIVVSFFGQSAGWLAILVIPYGIFLQTIITNAVYSFGWGKAVLTVFLSMIILAIFVSIMLYLFINYAPGLL